MTRPLPLPHRNLLLVTLPPPRLKFPISLPGAKHLPLFPLRPRSLSLSPLRPKPLPPSPLRFTTTFSQFRHLPHFPPRPHPTLLRINPPCPIKMLNVLKVHPWWHQIWYQLPSLQHRLPVLRFINQTLPGLCLKTPSYSTLLYRKRSKT